MDTIAIIVNVLQDVQVTVEDSDERNFESLWMRREVNRCIRENWENCHRVNVLCYIAHLQYLRNTIVDSNTILSLMLSTAPTECRNPSNKVMTAEKALKVVKHFESVFKASDPAMKFETDRQDIIAFLSELISKRIYEKDVDRAVVSVHSSLKVNCLIISVDRSPSSVNIVVYTFCS
ncbi:hypothetical protein GCK32_011857 [Trichostrongylus colubriformis]|uniref:Uncharacterized protein n=1 Tax=Trichostrongylus colubriformis TaxID=6319 RepID=A0AAN8IFX2_TRICO